MLNIQSNDCTKSVLLIQQQSFFFVQVYADKLHIGIFDNFGISALAGFDVPGHELIAFGEKNKTVLEKRNYE